jgi:hypothetical protein
MCCLEQHSTELKTDVGYLKMWKLIPEFLKRKMFLNILGYTKDVLETRGWIQGKSIEHTNQGYKYDPVLREHCKYCLSAAISVSVEEIGCNINYALYTYYVLGNFIGVPAVLFNDRHASDIDDVLKVLDNAIYHFSDGGKINTSMIFRS